MVFIWVGRLAGEFVHMSDFAERWERFLKKPGKRSVAKLIDLLEIATPEQVILLVAHALKWIDQIKDVPGYGQVSDQWRSFLHAAFLKIRSTPTDITGLQIHETLLLRMRPLADRARVLLNSGGPALFLCYVEHELELTREKLEELRRLEREKQLQVA
jgi:hypothetical protein